MYHSIYSDRNSQNSDDKYEHVLREKHDEYKIRLPTDFHFNKF